MPVPHTWQLQEAKARFSEVFRQARAVGPQRVTRQGTDAVIVLSEEEFERLKKPVRKRKRLVQILRESPFARYGITIDRDPDREREVEL